MDGSATMVGTPLVATQLNGARDERIMTGKTGTRGDSASITVPRSMKPLCLTSASTVGKTACHDVVLCRAVIVLCL